MDPITLMSESQGKIPCQSTGILRRSKHETGCLIPYVRFLECGVWDPHSQGFLPDCVKMVLISNMQDRESIGCQKPASVDLRVLSSEGVLTMDGLSHLIASVHVLTDQDSEDGVSGHESTHCPLRLILGSSGFQPCPSSGFLPFPLETVGLGFRLKEPLLHFLPWDFPS